MSPDEVGRGGRTGADLNERRVEETPPSRRGQNEPSSTARAEPEHDARDDNPQNDETEYRARLHALLRRSDAWRTQTLVRLAPSRGFVDAETRQSAWPRVLGIAEIDKRAFRDAARRTHADSSVVDADCARSLWAFTSAWREEDREAARVKLKRVIDGAVNTHTPRERDDDDDDDARDGRRSGSPGGPSEPLRVARTRFWEGRKVHYYQGFHDLCSVLLLNCGEKIACACAERLAVFHQRDATRAHVAPLLDALSLVSPLLESVDEDLHAHVFGAVFKNEKSSRDFSVTEEALAFLKTFLLGAPLEAAEETLARAGLRRCVFAVAWQMTWHVHGLGDLCGGTRVAPPPDSEDEAEAEATEATAEAKKTIRKKRREHVSATRADAFRLRVASRLVDFFITAHPAMPLYVGVEAMRRDRAYLLSAGTDEPAELHVALSKLRVAPDWRPTRFSATNDFDDDDDDDDDDATETAAFAALETLLASARELFRANPPDAMYRLARVEPPAGCAHAEYPYPWLSHDAIARDATSSMSSLSRAPLPPEVFHENIHENSTRPDGAWRRWPSRKRRALALRAKLSRAATTTTPAALGAVFAAYVAFDLVSVEKIERAVVFKTADACTDPIFRELALFAYVVVRTRAEACLSMFSATLFAGDVGAVARTVAAVAAVFVSVARRSSVKGVLAVADRWLGVASNVVRFTNASWYARSRAGATSPRKIAR